MVPPELLLSAKSLTDIAGTDKIHKEKPSTTNSDHSGPSSTVTAATLADKQNDFDDLADSFCVPVDDSLLKGMSEEEHMEMLHMQREQCLTDGYMLEKPQFDHLHYEDPRVTELKRTDVSAMSLLFMKCVHYANAYLVCQITFLTHRRYRKCTAWLTKLSAVCTIRKI